MNPARVRAVIVLILMVLSFAGAQAWKPRHFLTETRPAVKLETLFPENFGDWRVDRSGPVQLIAPDAAALINKLYNDTLSRSYVNSRGDRVMLSVAYGGDQSDGTRAHRPEVCYPAQGFQLLSSRDAVIKTDTHPVRARQLVAKLGGRIEPISYWVVVGEHIALSGTDQKLAQLSYSVKGVIADGMLVRVSNISGDAESSFQLHQEFVQQLARAVAPAEQARVIGATGS
jgi:EpsI family protein